MLCSGVELGVTEDMYPGAGYNGLLVFPEDTEVGADVKPILGLDEWIFDVSITANRPDCQSIYGLAREVAAALDKPLKEIDLSYTETDVENEGFSVTVEDPDLCPRYIGHYVYDVKLGQSPLWMRRRLAMVGNNSINNIVDITNYIMRELGQPMHAFDGQFLEGNKIVVRRAKAGEKIVTLDENEFELTTDNLVICDGAKPVALAGIMGGLNSEIRDTTTTVTFEAAKFMRDNIRKSSRALGQSSDSSAAFSKGVYEYTTVIAMKRALHLIEELGAGKVSKTHVDVNTGNSLEKKIMKASIRKVNGVLGIEVPENEIKRILTNLKFEPEINGDELIIKIPAYREDMEDYPDIAEELIRMYGYDHVEPTFLKSANVTMGGRDLKQKTELKIKRALCAQGAFECMHYSFFSPGDLDLLRFEEDAEERKVIRILNPINEDLSIMRSTLAAQMIHASARNQKKGNLEGRLFELANRFVPKSLPLEEYPEEKATLCIGVFGEGEDIFTLKGLTENVAAALNLSFKYEPTTKTFLHPYRAAKITCEGEEIGYLGQITYEIQDETDMRIPAYVCEIDLSVLCKWYGKTPVFEPLSKFPIVKRDLALIMDKTVTCGEVEDAIYGSCKYVTDVKLFDVYEGLPIPPTKKSMAFTITFTPKDEELTYDAVSGFVDKMLRKLSFTMGIEIRS